MPSHKLSLPLLPTLFAAVALGVAANANAQMTALHSFGSSATDGIEPYAGVTFDEFGNLYGTTIEGGTDGLGAVFELSPQLGGGWSEQVLYSFGGTNGNGFLSNGVILDSSGNLYGIASFGGSHGYGLVYELARAANGTWNQHILHNFNNNGDGRNPFGNLVFDASGNLYGSTVGGGTYGGGTVFELERKNGGSWAEKILHSFNFNGKDGTLPAASLIFDSAGNLYGTASNGGLRSSGAVFELIHEAAGSWKEKILYAFHRNTTDGREPSSSLVFDASGNLYSTTREGGVDGFGTVFELIPQANGGWSESVIHSFDQNGTDGATPLGGLIFDDAGNIYGTTLLGGPYNGGTVYELTNSSAGWTESILFSLSDSNGQPAFPGAGLVFGADGNLYGTTTGGGIYSSEGTVFALTP